MTTVSKRLPAGHRHTAVTQHVVGQQAGVPYELERTVCSACGRTLAEQTVRRLAA